MVRVPLTICTVCLLLGGIGSACAVQQIHTGTGGAAQPSPSPRYGTQVVPRSPAAAVKPAPGNRAPGPAQAAPKKNPQVAGAAQTAPTPATLPPMGPPAPRAEIPKPSRPADMPPVPPQVTYRNGMLTVNAVNSTMSGLLSAIRAKTGIEFDGAENASERVAVNLGPAPEGEVLAGIFSGSNFDYVVLGRADSPSTVQRVILTPKSRGGPGGPVVAGAPPQPQQATQAQAQQEGEEDVPDEAAVTDQDQQPQDSAIQPPPVEQPAPQNQQVQPQQNNGPKTPEQLLEELKQMQLQQQQQQGQPPPNPNSVPRKPPD